MQRRLFKRCYTAFYETTIATTSTRAIICSLQLPLLVATKQHNEKIRLDKISVNGKTTCIGGLGGLEDSSVYSFFSNCVNKQTTNIDILLIDLYASIASIKSI
jgi:hypothetical protein